MLCEERGFFLEIADVIRGFQLNILKGVIEARDDKIWARFIVEVNYNKINTHMFVNDCLFIFCFLFSSKAIIKQPNKQNTFFLIRFFFFFFFKHKIPPKTQ
jgi:hypothetical protein